MLSGENYMNILKHAENIAYTEVNKARKRTYLEVFIAIIVIFIAKINQVVC